MTLIDFDKYYKTTNQGCDIDYGCLPNLVQGVIKDKVFEGCKKILDIGCGSGIWTNFLRENGFEVVPCDIDNKQFKESIVTDMHQLCFKDGEFDGIFCSGVFEHSIAPFIMLSEMSRVLKIGGIFYVNMPTIDNNICLYNLQHINTQCYHNMINLTKKVKLKLLKFKKLNTPRAGMHQEYVFRKTK